MPYETAGNNGMCQKLNTGCLRSEVILDDACDGFGFEDGATNPLPSDDAVTCPSL